MTTFDMVRAHAGPRIIGIGLAMIAVALLGYGAEDHRTPHVAAPRPDVTVTATAPAPEPARTTVVARPGSRTTPAGVVPVSDVTAAMPHASGGGLSHGQARPPSAPRPGPTAQPPAGSSCAIGLTVLALNACVGGSR